MPASEVAAFGRNFVEERVFGFGEVAGDIGLFEADFVAFRFGDVVGPGRFGGGGVGLLVDEIKDLAEDGAVGHGGVGSGGDGAAPAGEGFAVGQIEEFDELHVVHAAAAGFEKAGGGLGGLGLVEAPEMYGSAERVGVHEPK